MNVRVMPAFIICESKGVYKCAAKILPRRALRRQVQRVLEGWLIRSVVHVVGVLHELR